MSNLELIQLLTDEKVEAYQDSGVDTIELIGRYKTLRKKVDKMGLEIATPPKNSPINATVKRFKTEGAKVEIVKLSKGRELSNYMIVVSNCKDSKEYARANKKSLDTYSLVIFAGLHQPSKAISNKTMRVISKLLRYKYFKLHSFDVAIDHNGTTNKEKLKNIWGGNIEEYKGTQYHNNPKGQRVQRVVIYDKLKKMTKHHGQQLEQVQKWERIEVTIKPDAITNFKDYIEGMKLYEDLQQIKMNLWLLNIDMRGYYLNYQLNGILDNRFLSHKNKSFNAIQSIERFVNSESSKKRYYIP